MKNLARFALIVVSASLFSACAGPQANSVPNGVPQKLVGSLPSYQVLHRFGRHRPGHDHGGANPEGGLFDLNSTLYGTTEGGGRGAGTVYSISTTGVKKTLYEFHGAFTDGGEPQGSLVAVNGTLYGTTINGGTCNGGTVYSITTTGTETVLKSFCTSDGINPSGGLIAVNGTLYGSTQLSQGGWGTIYSLTTTGDFKVVHTFTGAPHDGAEPLAGLLYEKGTLYGTTIIGGSGADCYYGSAYGCGTAFGVRTTGKESMLYSFQGGSDGYFPLSGLIDVKGTLYGTTSFGGAPSGCGSYGGCGTVYRIDTTGKESVLYRFTTGSDGANPNEDLLDVGGTLYGVTEHGSSENAGTIFSVTTSGDERVLHGFGGSGGRYPQGALINVNGALYGTTYGGGSRGCGRNGCGTVFALTP